ncbi:TPA: transcriptional regulator [Serratia fonticola]
MRFIINKTVLFDEEQGTLEKVDTSYEIKKLSLTEIRLIRVFVEQPNVVISRDSLLIDVWEKHDLTASVNNLNNYMSMIRRKLALLGLHEVIITIPKAGFSLTVDSVDILPDINKLVNNGINHNEAEINHSQKNVTARPPLNKINFNYKLIVYASALILLTAYLSHFLHLHAEKSGLLNKNDMVFYKTINNCDIYFLNGSLTVLKPGSVAEKAVADKIAQRNLKKSVMYIYQRKRSINQSVHSNFMYSLCGEKDHERCETTYLYDSKGI